MPQHKIAIVIFDQVVPADFTTPLEIFQRSLTPKGVKAYDVKVCAMNRKITTPAFDIEVKWTLKDALNADTLIIPGINSPEFNIPKKIRETIISAHLAGKRIVSICTGAFIVAATGILNNQNATTHWAVTDLLAQTYPSISVLPNVLFTDNGQVLTSAGASAATDLCLHIINKDLGVSAATESAKLAVAPLARSGGQAQFIIKNTPHSDINLAPLLAWIESRLSKQITLKDMCDFASLSLRTLNRRFKQQLDTSPNQWVIKARVRKAQYLLESTNLSIEKVAETAGFTSSTILREHFNKTLGTCPTLYRKTFTQSSNK